MIGMAALAYPQAFVLTVLIEGAVIGPWWASLPRPGRAAVGLIGVNALTHGLLWTLFPQVHLPYAVALPLAELLVFGVEAALLSLLLEWSWRRGIALSLLANLTSTLVGLCITAH